MKSTEVTEGQDLLLKIGDFEYDVTGITLTPYHVDWKSLVILFFFLSLGLGLGFYFVGSFTVLAVQHYDNHTLFNLIFILSYLHMNANLCTHSFAMRYRSHLCAEG